MEIKAPAGFNNKSLFYALGFLVKSNLGLNYTGYNLSESKGNNF